jgi:hypothetical protein
LKELEKVVLVTRWEALEVLIVCCHSNEDLLLMVFVEFLDGFKEGFLEVVRNVVDQVIAVVQRLDEGGRDMRVIVRNLVQ